MPVEGEILACLKKNSQCKMDGRLPRVKYQEGILDGEGHGEQEGGREKPAESHEYNHIRDQKEKGKKEKEEDEVDQED